VSNQYRQPDGGLIDRSQLIEFRFNGKSYQGYRGDSLAAALLANGVCLTARSFKYHRPRGIIGAGYEEPASLVELVGDEESGNQPITRVMIRPGLSARSVNCWPSPQFDLMAVNQLFARLLPAAFYYKTFKWPHWKLYEPSIRRAAGLATAPARCLHRGHYETRHAHCDVLIAGAGPAGLLAALHAGRSGARVILADDGVEPGGSLLNQRVTVDNKSARAWIDAVVAELDALPGFTRLAEASVWAYREDNLLMINQRTPREDSIFQRGWRVRAKRVVIACGALERNLVFANNDRPGVMLASAVQAYLNRFAVRPGRRAVVFTNNSGAYAVAADLRANGIDVAAMVDSRARIDAALRDGLAGTPLFANHVIETTHGRGRVNGVTLRDNASGEKRRLDCDLVVVSGGWNPNLHLFSQARGRLEWNAEIASYSAAEAIQQCLCIGAAASHFTLSQVFADALARAQELLTALEIDAPQAGNPPQCDAEVDYAIEPLWHVAGDQRLAAKSFIDVQNDVTLADVQLAIREGFGTVEHVKRYTTAGMGIDQGKTGNLNVVGAIAGATGATPAEIGTTTFRSPYVPIEFGVLTGIREESVYLPYRHTPLTAWHKASGACIYEAGARWRRPGYYPQAGESFQQTVNRESLAVREGVGVYDGAPLGKFEIKGRDAARFLDTLYTNRFANLQRGRGRYGIMLSDDGMILDDGVSFKLADHHYLMSTSTGNADRINQHMEFFLQTHRPDWQVRITTVTTQWANATLCGPRARELAQLLAPGADLSNEALPFMAMLETEVAGIPARICRVSFTGELSFEINVWSRHFASLWERIMAAGETFGIMPIGSEANHVLRVEKGFLSLGHEVDGTADPYDLGLGWIMSDKPDYLGKRAVQIRRAGGEPRRELVGLLIEDPQRLVEESAPITPQGRREASEGFVSACVWSVVQQRSIALALLLDGRQRIGETVYIRMQDEVIRAEVTRPCFHDPDGKRLRG